MEKFATDNLILLEFLVDSVNLEYGVQQDIKSMEGETCVSFQFLDNAPLFVAEEDFMPNKRNYTDGCGGCSSVKNGKSCLFALSPKQAEECLSQFDIYVEVFRKFKPGCLPEKLQLGESLISIVNLFNELVEEVSAATDDNPIAKMLKDCFKIQNTAGELVGHISVYIRMSCFGKLIVTQFQMNLENKSVEFKAKEGHYLFKYNKKAPPSSGPCPPCIAAADSMTSYPTPQQDFQICPLMTSGDYGYNEQPSPPASYCPPQPSQQFYGSPQTGYPAQSQFDCPPQYGYPTQTGYPPQAGYPSQFTCPALSPQQPPPGFSQSNYQSLPPQLSPCQQTPCEPPPCQKSPCQPSPCAPPPPAPPAQQISPMDPCQNYQQMMMAQQQQMDTPCQECSFPQQQQLQQQGDDNDDSDYQEIGAEMGGNALIIRVHKDKIRVEDMQQQNEDECTCEPGGPRGGAKNPSTSGKRCIDSCPDSNSPFTFKLGGAQNSPQKMGAMGGRQNNVTLDTPTCTKPAVHEKTSLVDPNKDVFILRVGKKNENPNKKNNFEIEVCTPKGKDFKPPPKLESREAQCEDDLNAGDDGGKKGKGKKGGAKEGGKKKGKGKGKK